MVEYEAVTQDRTVVSPESGSVVLGNKHLSADDIRHNMKVLIMLDAIFTMGITDLAIVAAPMWKYLHATNTQIGIVGYNGIHIRCRQLLVSIC